MSIGFCQLTEVGGTGGNIVDPVQDETWSHAIWSGLVSTGHVDAGTNQKWHQKVHCPPSGGGKLHLGSLGLPLALSVKFEFFPN